jgi:hypothetical protein
MIAAHCRVAQRDGKHRQQPCQLSGSSAVKKYEKTSRLSPVFSRFVNKKPDIFTCYGFQRIERSSESYLAPGKFAWHEVAPT